MKTIKYTFSISIGLLVLIMIEGLFTMGSAFDFATYSVIGWIAQVVAVMFIVSASILCCHSELMEGKQSSLLLTFKITIMEKEKTVTEMCEEIKAEMLAKLEQQKQDFINAYINTYGEMPKCYAND